MQLEGESLLNYQVYEYLLVLHPHEALQQTIMQEKESFAKTYEADQARWGRPHITLANFLQYEMVQPRLLQRLQAIALSQQPIKIELKDYGSFPAHTIYINITSKVPVQTLVKNIRTNAQRLMKLNDDNKPHFIMEPHLSIARKLKPWQYEKGWLEYSHKTFSGRFVATGMLLLRRLLHTQKYERVKAFTFESTAVAQEQGSLFG
jgi:2'-5' RNA ligase